MLQELPNDTASEWFSQITDTYFTPTSWNNSEPYLCNYLIPSILAFRTYLNAEVWGKVCEIRLARIHASDQYVNGRHISVFIRIEDTPNYPGLTAEIRETFNTAMNTINVIPRTVVFDSAWFNTPASAAFAEEIHDALLLYDHRDPESFITAKMCIESFYEGSLYHDGKDHDIYNSDMLHEFITHFHKLDFIHKQSAISEPPTIYDSVIPGVYGIVAAHVRMWVKQYYLNIPAWLDKSCYQRFLA